MKERAKNDAYQKRLDRIINYIYDHLDEDLDLDRLAEIACLSRFHWHRIYKSLSGETLAATVKRLRLHRAAGQLVHTKMSLQNIAAGSGYSSLSAFSRAFSQSYGMPPVRYRERGDDFSSLSREKGSTTQMHEIEFKEIQSTSLIGLYHEGPYMGIGLAFEKLGVWAKAKGLEGADASCFGVYFDDPDLVPAPKLKSFAGVVDVGGIDFQPPFVRYEIDAGRYAVLRFKGPYTDLASAYNWLYGTWLKGADVEVRSAPCFEQYINDPREVEPGELITDIYMPIESSK